MWGKRALDALTCIESCGEAAATEALESDWLGRQGSNLNQPTVAVFAYSRSTSLRRRVLLDAVRSHPIILDVDGIADAGRRSRLSAPINLASRAA